MTDAATGSTPANWARVQLTQGQSGAGLWDLSSAVPQARISVGAGPDAGWNVQAGGVLPVHFELAWDGTFLWVSPPAPGGSLAVNNEQVSAWKQLTGRCALSFGQAVMTVDTSQQSQTVPVDAGNDFASGEEVKTVMWSEPAPAAAADFEAGATRLIDLESPAMNVPRPEFGKSQGISLEPSPAADFMDPGSTRILDTESLGVELPAPSHPSLLQKNIHTDVLPQGGSGSPTGGFAMPPVGGKSPGTSKLPKTIRGVPILAVVGGAAILFFLLVGGVGFMLKKKAANEAAAQAQANLQRQQEAVERAQAAAQEEERARVAQVAEDAANAQRLRESQNQSIGQRVERARQAAIESGEDIAAAEQAVRDEIAGERHAAEREAVNLVVTNRYQEALVKFTELAAQYPDGNFGQMIPVLRSMARCQNGVGPGGTPCN